MNLVRAFGHGLSELLREEDTRTLEFVIGLFALIIGGQFFLGLVGLTTSSPLLRVFPFPLEFVVSLVLVIGAIIKISGAIFNHTSMRMYAALATSIIWWILVTVNFTSLTIFSILFASILALQSAWIYIRLSILRKRGQV